MARRMPRPPPPAVALIMMGKPMPLDTRTASSSLLIRPSEPGTVGTPACCRGQGRAGRAGQGQGRGGGREGTDAQWVSTQAGHPDPEIRHPSRYPAGAYRRLATQTRTPHPVPVPVPSAQCPAHLHGVARGGLVAHDADRVGLGPNELQAVVVADVHKGGVLRQEAVALQPRVLWPGGAVIWGRGKCQLRRLRACASA